MFLLSSSYSYGIYRGIWWPLYYLTLIITSTRYQVFGAAEYQVPPITSTTWQDYVDHTAALPLSALPQVFGLHANADIAKDHHEADQVSFILAVSHNIKL